jgi:hypothetical protein
MQQQEQLGRDRQESRRGLADDEAVDDDDVGSVDLSEIRRIGVINDVEAGSPQMGHQIVVV